MQAALLCTCIYKKTSHIGSEKGDSGLPSNALVICNHVPPPLG